MTFRRSAALLIAAWAAARLILFLLFDPAAAWDAGDAAYYLEVARSIAAGQGHALGGQLTAYRPPGYPAFLAPLAAAGALPWAAYALQGLATLAAALATLARIPGRVGLWAALAIAACPFIVAVEWRLHAEAPMLALTWCAWLLLSTPDHRPWLAGVLLGAAALLRETALLIPIVALPMALPFDRQLAKRLAAAAAAALLVVAPWQLRNAWHGVDDSRLGFNLWIGTWERDASWYRDGLDRADYPAEAFRSAEERRRLLEAQRSGDDRPFRDAALDRMATDPAGTARAWAERYWRLWLGTRSDQVAWRLERGSALWTAVKAALWGLNLAVLAAGAAGMAWSVVRRSPLAALALPVLAIAAIYLPFHNVETRYSLPAIPFLLLFGAAAADAALRRGFAGRADGSWQPRTPGRPAPASQARPRSG